MVRTVAPRRVEEVQKDLEDAAETLFPLPHLPATSSRAHCRRCFPTVSHSYLRARPSMGRYGSVIFISGNHPAMKTEITPRR